jgi:hypothetical protein
MISIDMVQGVKHEQHADLRRRIAHDQLVRQIQAARSGQTTRPGQAGRAVLKLCLSLWERQRGLKQSPGTLTPDTYL